MECTQSPLLKLHEKQFNELHQVEVSQSRDELSVTLFRHRTLGLVLGLTTRQWKEQ